MTEERSQFDFGSGLLQAQYLRRYFDGFACELEAAGYTHLTIQGYAGSVAHFGYWALQNKLSIADWRRDTVDDFAHHRCRCPGGRRSSHISKKYSKRVRRFIIFLERQKVIVADKPTTEPRPSEFHEWLIQHRGLCFRTAAHYEHQLAKLLSIDDFEEAELVAAGVRSLVLKYAQCHSPSQTRSIVLAFRAYLRFLASKGRCQPGLDQAIPTIPQWPTERSLPDRHSTGVSVRPGPLQTTVGFTLGFQRGFFGIATGWDP